jgi:lipopolysaccharide export system protein LptA
MFALVSGYPAAGQAGGSALRGHNSDAPIDWGADRIEVQDRTNRVILSGNVVGSRRA